MINKLADLIGKRILNVSENRGGGFSITLAEDASGPQETIEFYSDDGISITLEREVEVTETRVEKIHLD